MLWSKKKTLPTFKKTVSPQQSDQMCCAHWQQGSTRWSGSTPVLELWGPWTQNLFDNIRPWRGEEAYNNEQDTTCRVIPIKKDEMKAVDMISPPQSPIFFCIGNFVAKKWVKVRVNSCPG